MKTNNPSATGQSETPRSSANFAAGLAGLVHRGISNHRSEKLLFFNLLCALLLFTACSGAKSDAKQLAKKACECQTMEESGSADKQKVDDCWKDAFGMTLEMREKYKDDTLAIEVFEQVLTDAEKECVTKK